MASGISVLCFGASYAVAFGLELLGLWFRFGWHRFVMIGFAVAGLIAHTAFLAVRASQSPASPLASAFDWYLLAAWVVAAVYLIAAFYAPRTAIGLFVIPLALLLVGGSQLASRTPFAVAQVSRFWSGLHAGVLLLGTVAVCFGFLAGLMYLIQSYRLKRALPPAVGFRLPSLEWLDRVNGYSLTCSAFFMAIGFFSGLVLSNMKHYTDADYRLWADPVVLSLAAMLSWLVVAEGFRLIYPAARQGRKVAYLTLAAFLFLVFTLVSLTALDTVHGQKGHGQEAVGRRSGNLRPLPPPSMASLRQGALA